MKSLINNVMAVSMMILLTFASCKKNEVKKEEAKFDINNPVGYFIYVRFSINGSWPSSWLFEFSPGKTLKFHEASAVNGQVYTYEVIDGNIISLKGLNYRFLIENGKITSENFEQVALVKASETNQLRGKTFAGTYYKPNHSVLHENFFYSFSSTENKVDAGFKVGTAVRTETYKTIGNIAAWADKDGTGDIEFLLLLDGKLEVNYYNKTIGTRYYGSFSPQ
uniref:hypothetical protein n=1 Tax=Pedobacter schmidteae TaxID=2201271 RepID=UPI000EB44691|nr:hypothetical protein [Pedobacter schmidteae]